MDTRGFRRKFNNKAIITLNMMDPERPLKIPIKEIIVSENMMVLTLIHGAERFIPLYNVKWFELSEVSAKDESDGSV